MSQDHTALPAETVTKPTSQGRPKKPAATKRPRPVSNRTKPTKILPTDRITFPRQLALLRAYAAASGPNNKVVTNSEVAGIVKMTASTVSISNAFFADTGLLVRAAEGGYLPASDVVSFQRAYEWNPETASLKIGPVIAGTWFAKALLPKLAFEPITETEALETLDQIASAGPAYRSQLRVCLEYMGAAGLIQREGNMIRLARTNGQGGETMERPPAQEIKEPPKLRASVTTGFLTQPTEGVVQFNVSVRADMKELEGWKPDRIASFFAGIAQVLAAKGTIEREAGS